MDRLTDFTWPTHYWPGSPTSQMHVHPAHPDSKPHREGTMNWNCHQRMSATSRWSRDYANRVWSQGCDKDLQYILSTHLSDTLIAFRACTNREHMRVQIQLHPGWLYGVPFHRLHRSPLHPLRLLTIAHLGIYLILCEINVKVFFGDIVSLLYYVMNDIISVPLIYWCVHQPNVEMNKDIHICRTWHI